MATELTKHVELENPSLRLLSNDEGVLLSYPPVTFFVHAVHERRYSTPVSLFVWWRQPRFAVAAALTETPAGPGKPRWHIDEHGGQVRSFCLWHA